MAEGEEEEDEEKPINAKRIPDGVRRKLIRKQSLVCLSFEPASPRESERMSASSPRESERARRENGDQERKKRKSTVESTLNDDATDLETPFSLSR